MLALVSSPSAFFVAPSAFAPRVLPRMEAAEAPATTAGPVLAADIWAKGPPVRVQGDSLRTWDLINESTERVQLSIKSSGRPVHSNIELWHTPSYVPMKFSVYTEDGAVRPVDAIIETPQNPKTVAVYNTGSIDFPFDATVVDTGLGKAYYSLQDLKPELVQGGGMVTSYTFGPEVQSVQVLLKTDERNMKAKIELTQGPNQIKQVVEVYASKGYKNHMYVVMQTPGSMNTIRVINQNTVEFPFDAWIVPYDVNDEADTAVKMGGGF